MGDIILTVRSTREQIEEFKSSILWKDIKRELGAWKKGFQIEQQSIVSDAAETNPSTATVLMHLGDLNGRMKAVNYMIQLPDIFLQVLEDQKNELKHK